MDEVSGEPRRRQLRSIAMIVACLGVAAAVPVIRLTGVFNRSYSAQEQRFASEMRQYFGIGSDTTIAYIVGFGQQICQATPGTTDQALMPRVKRNWTNLQPGDALEMMRLSQQYLCPAELDQYQTVTYLVTGAPAQVTYGTAPDNAFSVGSVPMSVTDTLDTSADYTINGVLNGGGPLTCSIEIDGVAISTHTVSASQGTTYCGASVNLYDRSWEDDNAVAYPRLW